MGCYIYKITNKENNMSYIGCTITTIEKRFKEHVNRCKKIKTKFCDALNKYGKNNFILEQIDFCDDTETMYELEKEYIKKYNTFNEGYNLTLGGEGCIGYKHTSDIRKKISERTKMSYTHKDLTYEEIYGEKAEEQKNKRKESVKLYWANISEEEKIKRVNKAKNTLKERGSNKCGKNPFSKPIIIENVVYECWSQAEESLKMSKYKIKKRFNI
jgi:group I intron endonuclease